MKPFLPHPPAWTSCPEAAPRPEPRESCARARARSRERTNANGRVEIAVWSSTLCGTRVFLQGCAGSFSGTSRTITSWYKRELKTRALERAEAGKESHSTPPSKDCHRNVSKGCGFECRKDPADTAFSTLRDPFALAPISPNPTRPGRAAWVACSWYAVGGGRGSGVAPGAGSPHPWAGAVAVTRQQRAWVWRCSCCGFVAPSGRRGDARAEAR